MNDQRLALVLLAAVGMGAGFMPWTRLPVLGYTIGTETLGWVTFTLYLIILVIAVVGKRSALVSGMKQYVLIFLSLVAAGIGIWEILDKERMFVSVEYGLYLTALVGLVIPVATFLFGKKRKDSGNGKADKYSYDTEVGKGGAPD